MVDHNLAFAVITGEQSTILNIPSLIAKGMMAQD